MGRQFRQLCAAVEIPLLRDLPADEPALHLHGGLPARARALLSARRHACGGRMVPAGRARARVFEAVLLELSAARAPCAAGLLAVCCNCSQPVVALLGHSRDDPNVRCWWKLT